MGRDRTDNLSKLRVFSPKPHGAKILICEAGLARKAAAVVRHIPMPTDRATRTTRTQRTQWCAQFLAASELVRLGYVVSFTMGSHTPTADLMVGVPQTGLQFWVDVKLKNPLILIIPNEINELRSYCVQDVTC